MSDTSPEQAFTEALVAFQESLPHIGKGQTADTGSYKYEYADLTDCTDAGFPPLTKQGLAFSCRPTLREDGTFVLRYALKHTGGHSEGGDYPLPANGSPQQIGSAITYGRRYCFCAVTGLAPGGDDDDGQGAAGTRIRQPERAPEPVRVTDFMWLEDVRSRLVACGSPAEVRGLIAEATQIYAENRLSTEDARLLRKEMDERTAELRGEVTP